MTTTLLAGIPEANNALYHQIRFAVGDPAALIIDGEARTLILRDIEMERARARARADEVRCPADFTPAAGLSGDRETATAQAVAECLRRRGTTRVRADRTLPLIFADHLRQAGIGVDYDPDLGVADRRAKDADEIRWLREAQAITEQTVRMACEMVARADVDGSGQLRRNGMPLTADHVRYHIDTFLLERGCTNTHGCIVAGGPQGADCHHRGDGVLQTAQPVIIDVFPRVRDTRYNGDCTRTVVHGDVPAELALMHQTVCQALDAAIKATRASVTGDDVHRAAASIIETAGYHMGLPPEDADDTYCSMPHGTGHGIGLDVHEPPLLDRAGPPLVAGDALTVEPGLYCRVIGGVRVEDMVVVTEDGCDNLNTLPRGLSWA